MKCLRCGKEFKDKNREFCDECGYDFNEGKRLNKILNSNIVLVSDVRAGFYNVYDLNTQKVIQKNKISIPITVITIVDKAGIDKL